MTTTTTLERKIWVLFASQTGNSEQAARKIAALLPDKCRTGTISHDDSMDVVCEVMQLDDFLELERAPWTPIVILCLSSYGVGQAPLGGYRFREFCDYIVNQHENHKDNSTSTTSTRAPSLRLLQDLQFALLGLGDSKYTTFFENPTQTNRALELAGATRIGPIGKADAASKKRTTQDESSSSSSQQKEQAPPSQETVIDEWIDNLWKPLQDAIRISERVSPERLLQMQQDTCAICAQINPDFKVSKRNGLTKGAAAANTTVFRTTIAIAIVAIVLAFILPSLVFK